jgi:uncharacterized repeat protein (TIGR02543 family)
MRKAISVKNGLFVCVAFAAFCAGMLFLVCTSDSSGGGGTTPGDSPKTYTLKVNVYPTGSGKVEIDPVKDKYEEGEPVVVRAVPEGNYQFDSWMGREDDLPTNPVAITMTKNETLTAYFKASGDPGIPPTPTQTYTLTVTPYPAGAGKVSRDPDKERYEAGETVTVTATPEANYRFDSWVNRPELSTNPVTITITKNDALTAMFIAAAEGDTTPTTPPPPPPPEGTYSLTVTSNPPAGGKVTRRPDKEGYEEGEVVAVAATPETGYEFDGWTGGPADQDPTSAAIIVTMTKNETLTANFKASGTVAPTYYTLKVNVYPATGGIVDGGGSYEAGTAVTLTAEAKSGYTFTGWSGDATGTASTVTVVMDGNKTVAANFESATAGNAQYCSWSGGYPCVIINSTNTEAKCVADEGEVVKTCPSVDEADKGSCDYGKGGCHKATRDYCSTKKGTFYQGTDDCSGAGVPPTTTTPPGGGGGGSTFPDATHCMWDGSSTKCHAFSSSGADPTPNAASCIEKYGEPTTASGCSSTIGVYCRWSATACSWTVGLRDEDGNRTSYDNGRDACEGTNGEVVRSCD